MSMTDPIADLLTRIRNAQIAKHDRLDVPVSRLKVEIAKLLKDEGFIKNFREIAAEPQGTLRIFLRYNADGVAAISHLQRVSRPGRSNRIASVASSRASMWVSRCQASCSSACSGCALSCACCPHCAQ